MISEINKPAGHGDLPRPLLFFIPQYHRKSTFFGHRDYPPTIKPAIKAAIEELVHNQSADMFYAGNNGQFDAYCRSVLKSLGINYAVVLYGMPGKPSEYKDFSDTMLPEGIVVTGPAHFTPERRNRWMVLCEALHKSIYEKQTIM